VDKEKIGNGQLFALIFLFGMGSSVVIPVGLVPQKENWISIIIASFGGILLFYLYYYLSQQYPGLSLSGYAQKILGKYAGRFVSFLYVLFFIFNGSRNLREAGDLLVTSIYYNTPLVIIETLLILVIMYALYKGIEVLARIGELYFLILVILICVGNTLIIISGKIHFDNLLPLLEDGWKPVLKNAYPSIAMFPYGEMICFAMIFPNLRTLQTGRKAGIGSLIFVTIALSMIHALEIAVLGEHSYQRSPFPLLLTFQKVQIGDFMERLDILAVLTLIICIFFKIAIYFLAAVIMAADIFNLANKETLILSVGFLVILSSILGASNLAEHTKEGSFVIQFVIPLYAAAFPFLLFAVHIIRKKLGTQPSD